MIALTSGDRFTDIDALASCLAMNELLTLRDIPSRVILRKSYSSSIVSEMYSWFSDNSIIETKDYTYPEEEVYMFDISEQEFISPLLDLSKITLLYDHHFGFSEQWSSFTIPNLKIERIGATATQVFEDYVTYGKIERISPNIANFLYTTIVTHTLNFTAEVTTSRDSNAAETLKQFTSVNDQWIPHYYDLLEAGIYQNVFDAVKNDTKIAAIEGTAIAFGQLEMWNGDELIQKHHETITTALTSFGLQEYLFSTPSLSHRKNFAFTNSSRIEKLLTEKLGFIKQGDILKSPKLMLRKEILKVIQ